MNKLFFLLIVITDLNAQKILDTVQITCTYSLTFQMDSTAADKKLEEAMVLYIGKNMMSKFLSYKSVYFDSLALVNKNKKVTNEKDVQLIWQQVNAAPQSKFYYKIFKDRSAKKITTFDQVLRDKYIYEEPISTVRWKIHPEQRTISGYKCQKATGSFAGRNYIAWFTNEIPVSDGPYKFNGLPGLIVTIADTRNQYVFTLKKVEKAKTGQYIYFPDDKLIKTTKKAYFKAYQDFKENAGQRYEDMGFTAMDPDHNRKVNERFKKQNNPIELVVE